ncbi:MAG: EAL domain-containing protein, partial [Zoogloea sp.]|nr:EAL domain-containing protein [Zoogloea sp.]
GRARRSDLGHDPNDAAIARTIVVLAHTLGLSVVAEGVETETQLAYLKWNRCDEIQGYLFSRPVPPESCETLLREDRRLAVENLPQPVNC